MLYMQLGDFTKRRRGIAYTVDRISSNKETEARRKQTSQEEDELI